MKHKHWHNEAIELKNKGIPVREISRRLFGKSSKESTLRSFFAKLEVKKKIEKKELKMLFWDTEISVKRSWHFQQEGYLGSKQIDKDFFLLSHQWAWGENSNEVFVDLIKPEDAKIENDFDIVLKAWHLLDKADVVVAHNGKRFDIKIINARFIKHGLPQPSPYKVIDTYQLARSQFGFTFKSLDYLCKFLDLPAQKLPHDGLQLWIDATLGDAEALRKIGVYGRGDIPTLQEVFKRLKGWGTGSVNLGAMKNNISETDTLRCPSCASDDVYPLNKLAHTNVNATQAYRCNGCSGISRLSGRNYNAKLIRVV